MIEQAIALAEERARAAGVAVAPLVTPAQAHAAAALLRALWGGPETVPSPNAIVALAHTGNYAVGVYDRRDGERLIGVSAGWFAPPRQRALHSHITGLLPAERGREVGTAVKLHQRGWSLARGLATITWTHDPLVARNAHVARNKLGARPVRYLQDFYGPMHDAVNGEDESDRWEVAWDLTAPWPPVPDDGAGDAVLVPVPTDIEELRRTDPEAARQWRFRLRENLVPLLAAGYTVTGFTRDRHYVLRPARSAAGEQR